MPFATNEENEYYNIFHKWFEKISELIEKYSEIDDNPFYYNETASVSFFASTAMMVGMLSLAEFSCQKIDSKKLQKAKKNGRSDLWVYEEKLAEHWFFEFKSMWINKNFSDHIIKNCIDAAKKDAKEIYTSMAHKRFAVALFTDVYSYYNKAEKNRDKSERLKNNQEIFEKFIEDYRKKNLKTAKNIYYKVFEIKKVQTFCIITNV